MKKTDEFGDRMKWYESQGTSPKLDVSLPICIRIDGRSFSKFTKGCERPFDSRISTAMRETCAYLVEETHAKVGYVQSDEISLILYANENGSIIFDGKMHKLNSVLASMAAVKFYSVFGGDKLPAFDCRSWNVPTKMEASNAILWRALDARKNSVSMACRAHNSAKSMHKKNRLDQVQMLAEKGIDFETAYPDEDKYGVFYKRVTEPTFIEDDIWDRIPSKKKPESRYAMRSRVKQIRMKYFGDVADKIGFIFGRDE
jgi:tRNA(His) 5'-end guanylyltransferase